ncbi:MAG: cyclase family protein [Chloroflexi bacterium]|nr:MAG: cyclase family protein [Chloroflexota bacterium]
MTRHGAPTITASSSSPRWSKVSSFPRLIDVSHAIVPGMKTYPGLPEPTVEVLLDYDASRERYQNQAEFYIASLHLCGNTGTYVDSPRHRYRDGVDLADLPLERLANLPALVVDARSAGRAIAGDTFVNLEVTGCAVLIRTDFSRRWGTPAYFTDNPFITADSAELLISKQAALVGIDSLNIDDTGDPSRPAHTKLLGAGIPVCEHMTNLDAMPPTGARLHAVPIAWVGGGTFPVRAYAVVGSG